MESSTGYGPRRILFDGDDQRYEIWELRFLGYMRLKKLHDVITATVTTQPNEEKNKIAFAELLQCLDDKSISLIMREAKDDGRKALVILRKHYLLRGKPRIIALYTELTSLVKKPSETITDYIIRAENASSQLDLAEEKVSEGLLIAMVMKGLPKEFTPFTAVILQKDEKLTFQDFKVALRNFEDSNAATSAEGASSVLHLGDGTRQQQKYKSNRGEEHFQGTCFTCQKRGHRSSECRSRSKRWCSVCRSITHDTKFCRKKDSAKFVQNSPRSDDDDNHSFAFTLKNEKVNEEVPDCTLLVDCGATTHIINDESKFVSFDKDFDPAKHFIEMADGRCENNLARKRGNVSIDLIDENDNVHKCILYDALYVPTFQNIFSVQAAVAKGSNVEFQPDSATLKTKNDTKFKINKRGKLYFLNLCKSKSAGHSLEEWHALLGHCNKADVLKLENVVEGMTITDKKDFECEICCKGKMTQSRNRKPDKRASSALDLIHLDLEGPIEPPSSEGFRYVLGCTDDYTGVIIPYMMKNKSDTPKAFEKFLADVRPYGDVKCVRSDGGGEFTSEVFNSLLTKNRIKQEFSAPYSPHQNGTAERSWRTLFEMSRCLLLEAKLPKSIWPYAVMCAAHTRNRCFNNRTKTTPYHSLTGEKPDLSKMHTFGSKCYASVQKPKKLEDRAEEGIFVGYDKQSPAYLVYFPHKQQVKKIRLIKCFGKPTFSVDEKSNDLVFVEENPEIDNENIEEKENDTNVTGTRTRTRPKYLDDYVIDTDNLNTTIHYCYNVNSIDVPKSYSEAIISNDASEWDLAMQTEMRALEENDTFELVPPPKDKEIVGSKWVYAIKTNKDGTDHFKARFVAKGYSQIEGIDYQETFSPTAHMNSIRVISQIAVQNDLDIHQMDVKAAYLNAPIDCDIYVKQPEGFTITDEKGNKLVLKLKKSLYGLKQSGRNWNNTLDTYLREQGFKKSVNDPCFYTKDDNTFLVHWVDDILISAKPCILKTVKQTFEKRFKMKDLGQISYFLGIEFQIESNVLSMFQSRYISKVLNRFGMDDCKPRSTPCEMNPSHEKIGNTEPLDEAEQKRYRQIVGSLIYIMTATRPDISYTVTKLSQFLSCATQCHMTMAKHVLRYLKGTINDKMVFKKSNEPPEITGYCDSDWASSIEDRKSITGYSFKMSKNNPLISWKSRKQPTVALSTCEAEYMALCSATQEGKYLMSFLNEVISLNQTTFNLFCDNQGAIALAKNPINHKRSKHIDIKYHFIRNEISEGRLSLQYIPSEENIADVFTKPVSSVKLQKFKPMLMG